MVFRERLLTEDPATLQDLGRRYRMTREGLRQVEKRIVRDLKAFLRREIQDFRALDLKPPGEDPPSPPEANKARSGGTATKSRRKRSQA